MVNGWPRKPRAAKMPSRWNLSSARGGHHSCFFLMLNGGRRRVALSRFSALLHGRYPRTLILEKVSTARPEVGRPNCVAGWKVVKIRVRFSSGRIFSESLGPERMR